jgi:hypothetical protein
MHIDPRKTFVAATAIAVVCLLSAASARQQAGPDAPAMTEDVFKSVVLLKGIPVDTFLDSMGMFANAMGNDCTFCHASTAATNRADFALQTPRIQRARAMIGMMNAINKNYFKGEPRVTCFTCHNGNQSPRSDPNLALQYTTPAEDPNVRDFTADPTLSADRIFDKYLQAVGGPNLAKITSFTGKGQYSGFDTGFEKVPVEIYAKAPNQYATVVHTKAGNSVRAFDGRSGWIAGPDTPVPLLTLTAGNLDRARLEAMAAFPSGIRQTFKEWRVGRAVLDDDEVMVVQAMDGGQRIANFYFAPSGLLVRFVRWTLTPVGFVPTQVDYSDYRDVAGVKFPFKRTITQTYMRVDIELSAVQPNVAIDASRFGKPAPFKS